MGLPTNVQCLTSKYLFDKVLATKVQKSRSLLMINLSLPHRGDRFRIGIDLKGNPVQIRSSPRCCKFHLVFSNSHCTTMYGKAPKTERARRPAFVLIFIHAFGGKARNETPFSPAGGFLPVLAFSHACHFQ